LTPHIRKNVITVMQSSAEVASTLEKAPYGAFNGKVLFILAKFSNRAPFYSASSFASFLKNKIKDFYSKASHGKVTLSPASETYGTANDGIVGWLNLGFNHPNTGSNLGNIQNQKIAKVAIEKANPYVNFASYDTNGDGYVDADELAVVVIVAGYERSVSAAYTPTVWGHKWSLDNIGVPTVDGKMVGAHHGGKGGYALFGEIHRSNSTDRHMATMGIMVHEIGHLIFGLPDLYDTDSSSSGIGSFCVMSGGSWGKAATDTYSGQRPTMPSAWIKYNRGWSDGAASGDLSQLITASGSSTATSSNTTYRKLTDTDGEYFIVENRAPLGYDKGLQKWLGTSFGGIAIYHVDENVATNAADPHRKVDLEEADGTVMLKTAGSKTDMWYIGNKTVFSPTTTPNTKTYNGKSSCIKIETKSAPGATMKVSFTQTSGCCTAQTCGSFTTDCDPNVAPCFCFKQPDGKGKCVDNFWCSSAEDCVSDSDCPNGKACYTQTCCGKPVCGPTKCSGIMQGVSNMENDVMAACSEQ
jgi:M6 family metalloprotease-like protein